MGRSIVDKSSKYNFIKMILTKNQERSKRDKKWIRIKKSRYIESNGTCYYIEKFNMALSLYRVLEVTFYFSKGFLEITTEKSVAAEVP